MRTLTVETDPDLFKPNPGGQQQFLDDYEHRFVALAGGWYAGKTWAGARKLANLHVENAIDASEQKTFVEGALIGQNFSLSISLNAREMQDAFLEMGLESKLTKGNPCVIRVPALGTEDKPSQIRVLSAEAPESINGFTVGHIWGDEVARWRESADPKSDPMTQLVGRLRGSKARIQQAIFTFTHEGNATRVYRDFEENPKPGHVLYRAGTLENPHATQFAADTLEQLTPELASQYLDGLAANLRGSAVYASYDDYRNTIEPLELIDGLPLDVSIDFNISPGMHAVVGQEWPNAGRAERQQLVDVWEIHSPRMSVRGMVKALQKMIEDGPLKSLKWTQIRLFGDATGRNAWAGTGESCWDIVIEEMKEWGVPYRILKKDSNPHVADRVNAMNAAMCNAHGDVHYRCHKRCKRLIGELKYMKWDGNQMDSEDRKIGHISDAASYRVAYLMPIRKLERRNGQVFTMKDGGFN